MNSIKSMNRISNKNSYINMNSYKEANSKDNINKKKENKKYDYIVSYPHIGNYYIPIYNLLNHLVDKTKVKIMMPSKITSKTIVNGASVSPDFACLPFKYNMGNFIESLENGANVLIQAGGGCRYGYYYQVQEQILKDMGYNFTFIPLVDEKGVDILNVYKKFKVLNKKLSFKNFCYYFLLGFSMIYLLDEFETYMRNNYTYQLGEEKYTKIHDELLREMLNINNFSELKRFKRKYSKLIKEVPLKADIKNDIKIGIVGELFTSMEPNSSFFLEKELNKFNCKVKRYTTATYLLFQKNMVKKKVIKKASKYIKYHLGADGPETIAHTLELIDEGYDGIIHIKPFGCSPEINAMPILQKISLENNIPIMYLTFDEQTTATGVKTRIEAFYDMLKMRKDMLILEESNDLLDEERLSVLSEVKANLQTQS